MSTHGEGLGRAVSGREDASATEHAQRLSVLAEQSHLAAMG